MTKLHVFSIQKITEIDPALILNIKNGLILDIFHAAWNSNKILFHFIDEIRAKTFVKEHFNVIKDRDPRTGTDPSSDYII